MGKRIAITGGIGSGKSTALDIIKELGYSVFSCDEIYKDLINDVSYVSAIEKEFSGVVYNGKIDRNKLASIVFADETARKRLNAIAHSLIMQRLLKNMQEATGKFVFAEVPLLFEGNFQSLFDEVIVISRQREERVKAICQRDGVSEKEAYARMNTQFNYDSSVNVQKLQRWGVHILENEEDRYSLTQKINKLLSTL